MNNLKQWLQEIFSKTSLPESWQYGIIVFILCLATLLVILLVLYVARIIFGKLAHFIIHRTIAKWDDYILKHKVFETFTLLLSVMILRFAIPVIFENNTWLHFILNLLEVYLVYVIIRIIVAILRGTEDYISHLELYKEKPVASWFQLARILLYLMGGVLSLSILLEKSPLYFLGAFGAISAVVILVFKDTILGLVASIQISANDMVRVGDWVEMEKYNANGEVTAINLNTVKIRNWDKTYSTVPTHFFISDSFKNWRGMQESGGRRIKRPIYININSIKFVSPEMREEYKKIYLIKDYIIERQKEIEEYNKSKNYDPSILINGRRMTNIGVFRKYIESYLRNHPGINQEMTLIVRQMESGQYGLPIEVYCFTNTVKWVEYETIQSDIFDHIFSAARFFGLEVYQAPTGSDIAALTSAGIAGLNQAFRTS